jgi:hypothetical protein
MDSDPAIASQELQTNLAAIQNWFKMKNKSLMDQSRSITFITQIETKCNTPKDMPSILVHTLTGDLPGYVDVFTL